MADHGRLIAGAMSGTSADGVDVSIVRIEGRTPAIKAQRVAHWHRPYDPALRRAIAAARSSSRITLAQLGDLSRQISLVYAAAVNEALIAAGLSAIKLAAVAAHGQTLYHNPPITIQWLDPALLAAEVGCAVVSDFRRADCAAGGQGAPLVPFADWILFRHPTKDRVLLNIGGIANITHLPANCGLADVRAFDTGPGNCVSDWLMRQHHPRGRGYDEGGQLAARGAVIAPLLKKLKRAPYFAQKPPKSTDGPAMIGIFQSALCDRAHRLENLLATAAAWTAWSIATQLPPSDEIYAAGGGVFNAAIMSNLAEAGIRIRPISQLGIDPMEREAVAFAILGAATLDNEPSNVPEVTGARRPVVLGSITPKP